LIGRDVAVRVAGEFSYPAGSVEQVFRMLTDKAFQERKCAATGALSYSVSVSGEAATPVVESARRMPTDGLPDFARKLVRDGIDLREVHAWEAPAADGTRRSATTVSIAGQPVEMTGTLFLGHAATGVQGALAAELRVSVPLIGGRIERVIAPLILKALAVEEALGRQWLEQS
jgi:hypothetical protein